MRKQRRILFPKMPRNQCKSPDYFLTVWINDNAMAVAYPCRYPTSLCEGWRREAWSRPPSVRGPAPASHSASLVSVNISSCSPPMLPCRVTVNQCPNQHTVSWGHNRGWHLDSNIWWCLTARVAVTRALGGCPAVWMWRCSVTQSSG